MWRITIERHEITEDFQVIEVAGKILFETTLFSLNKSVITLKIAYFNETGL